MSCLATLRRLEGDLRKDIKQYRGKVRETLEGLLKTAKEAVKQARKEADGYEAAQAALKNSFRGGGHKAGHTAGHKAGHTAGHKAGHTAGHTAGLRTAPHGTTRFQGGAGLQADNAWDRRFGGVRAGEALHAAICNYARWLQAARPRATLKEIVYYVQRPHILRDFLLKRTSPTKSEAADIKAACARLAAASVNCRYITDALNSA
jgi:hypothetical protein